MGNKDNNKQKQNSSPGRSQAPQAQPCQRQPKAFLNIISARGSHCALHSLQNTADVSSPSLPALLGAGGLSQHPILQPLHVHPLGVLVSERMASAKDSSHQHSASLPWEAASETTEDVPHPATSFAPALDLVQPQRSHVIPQCFQFPLPDREAAIPYLVLFLPLSSSNPSTDLDQESSSGVGSRCPSFASI